MNQPLLYPLLGLLLAPAAWCQGYNDKWVAYQKDASMIAIAAPMADEEHEVDLDWGDLDADGWIDVVAVRKEPFMFVEGRSNVLLMNETGVLTDRTTTFAAASDVAGYQGFLDQTPDRDVVLVDVNNDGMLDVVTAADLTDGLPKVLSHPRVYRNLGGVGPWLGLRHEDVRIPELLHLESGLPKPPRFTAVDAGDVDLDGFADLYFGDQDEDPNLTFILQPPSEDLDDRLLINDGTGYFVDKSQLSMSGPMLSSAFCNSVELGDFNQDGVLDVLKQVSYAFPVTTKVAYNDPVNPGSYTSQVNAYEGWSYFVSSGDLNQDGRLDIVVTHNLDDGYLLNQGNLPGGEVDWSDLYSFDFLAGGDDGFGSNSLAVDLDVDGWNDVLITDVDPEFPGYNRRMHIYHNQGGTIGGAVDLLEERGSSSDDHWIGAWPLTEDDLIGTHDVAVFDVDRDGLDDMLLVRKDADDLWRRVPAPTCQTDLGYGGDAAVLEVCGGDLSSGDDAVLQVFNAPASSPAVLLVSASAQPVYFPLLHADLVALPPILALALTTDVQGRLSVPVTGGGGPATLVVQALVADGSPTLAQVTNAVEVTLLP